MACEYAELWLFDVTGTTNRGRIPVRDLQWSDEVGGGGGVSFTAKVSTLPEPDALDDCVVMVAVPLADGTPVPVGQPYAIRGDDAELGSAQSVSVSGQTAFRVWSQDATIRPEFAGDVMPRGAGEERGLSWVSSAYDPATDADEPWGLLSVVASRTARPTEPVWPTGTGADWITATTAENGDRKFFRSWLTIPDDFTLIRAYFSSDEGAILWVGGEALIQTDDTETGRKYTRTADRVFMAGTYAVAVETATHISKGGDGSDPVILAIAELDDDGDPASWLLVSGGTGWVATRRQVTGPGSAPPGPTPGAIITLLAEEAADRGVSTWVGLTRGFTDALDSDGVAWSTTEERIARYGFDSYLTVFDGLADVDCDMRISTGLELEARVFEGTDRSATVVLRRGQGAKNPKERRSPVVATVLDAYTVDGWLTRKSDPTGVGRREAALSLGSAPSLSQGERVTERALEQTASPRKDSTIEFVAVPGATPYVDFWPGDTVGVSDGDGSVSPRRVLSLSGAASSPVTWTAELGDPNV